MSAFFDTNIVVHAFAQDPKQPRATQLLADGGVISVQVLNEFTHVARRKHARPWPQIEAALAILRARFDPVRPVDIDTHSTALGLARDHGIGFYDALIVAAALQAGCTTLYSEDLQAGRQFGPLGIVNPFG